MRPFAPFVALLLTILPAAAARGASPDDCGPMQLAETIESRLSAQDPAGAVVAGESAVRSFPKNSDLWLALGKAYGEKARVAPVLQRFGFAKKCKAAFERAVELDPENVEARDALFQYYFEAPGIAGGSFSLARREAEEIVKIDPSRGHADLGALAMHEKDLPRAENELRLAIETAETDGDRAEARCQLALLYEKLGKRPVGIDALRGAVKLDPGCSQAKKDLKRLGG